MTTPVLSIRLLGELDLRLGDRPLPALDSARVESLLAFLLLHRDAPQSRQRLAFLLWPDSSERQARTNLRHVLHNLRRALPDAALRLDVTPRTLQWRADVPYQLDVADFEAALAAGRLREAVDAYAGDLLAGVYDDWVLEERERLRGAYLDALHRLAGSGERIDDAERLLREDPLHEPACRLLMRLYDARGERARALRVYHATSAALEHELGAAPSDETRAAYEALLPDRGPADPRAPRERSLVGREIELARLEQAWRDSARGRAQLALVSGEAGIGKTRLVDELRGWCTAHGAIAAEARSFPAEGALAFAPVAAWLRAAPIAARRGRLDAGRRAELARLLPELGPAPARLPAHEQRQRLFDAVAHALLAAGAPLLLVADDVQWADRETLQFLHYLLRVAPDAPLLVAATARREDADDPAPLQALVTGLQALDRCVEIELPRLSHAETAALAGDLAGEPLDRSAAARLFAETEGNPLFVVEALRAGWDGAGGVGMSPRIHAVIEARLARLSPDARQLAGVAAGVGREFTADLLAAAAGADVVTPLDELWRRRIVRDHGPDAYDFTHDRIREVTYTALSPVRRRQTHLRIARALERMHAGDPAELAAHYEHGGAADDAARWYLRAAEAAQHLHLDGEAVEHLERGLRRLAGTPPGPARDARELALTTAALAPLVAVDGYGSDRLFRLQERGLQLSAALGAEPEPPLLRSVAVLALARSDFERSRRFAERLRTRGERDGDDVLRVESDYVLGIAAFWQGRFAAAQAHFEAAVERYRPEHGATHVLRYGMDPKVVCLSRLANTLWFLGRTDDALAARDAALALSEQIGDPGTAGTAHVFAAMLALELQDDADLRRHADAIRARPRVHAVAPVGRHVEVLAGYLDAVDGHAHDGVARIRAVLRSFGIAELAPGHRASMLRVLVEACALAGDHEGGVDAAERLLEVPAGGLWRAEALRRRAVFRAQLGAEPAAVRAELEQALTVAREQGAPALERRVEDSLARGTLAERPAPHRSLP